MNREQADVLAHAIAIIRPDWQPASLTTLLGNVQHRPVEQVAHALIRLAYDPTQITPGMILKEGPHWATGAASQEATYLPPSNREPLCPTHGDRQPCRPCRADKLARPDEPLQPPDIEREPGETLAQYAHRLETANQILNTSVGPNT